MALKVFDLACEHDHVFEGWFSSQDSYQDQLSRGLVRCPVCHSDRITRRVSAPHLNVSHLRAESTPRAEPAPRAESAPQARAAVAAPSSDQMARLQAEVLRQIRRIVRQTDDDGPDNSLIIEAAMFNTGRPAIIVPYIQSEGFKLDRVLCCWDGGAPAARAVNDALPFLKRARAVEVLNVVGARDDTPKGEIRGIEIANHLARHNVKVEIETVTVPDRGVADTILSHAADTSADLIVMGGYGHSRLREFVLGGVTRDILRSMTVPAFLSR